MARNWKLFTSAAASFRMDDRGVPSGPSKRAVPERRGGVIFSHVWLVGTYRGFRIKFLGFTF